MTARQFAKMLEHRCPSGSSFSVDDNELNRIIDIPYGWPPSEWVLQFILGSNYDWVFWSDPKRLFTIFRHYADPIDVGIRPRRDYDGRISTFNSAPSQMEASPIHVPRTLEELAADMAEIKKMERENVIEFDWREE